MKVGEIASLSGVGQAIESNLAGSTARHEAADRREVLAAVKELDLPELRVPNRELSISYDRDTRQNIVQIVDKESGEVVVQIPGKEAVERARYYRELSGL